MKSRLSFLHLIVLQCWRSKLLTSHKFLLLNVSFMLIFVVCFQSLARGRHTNKARLGLGRDCGHAWNVPIHNISHIKKQKTMAVHLSLILKSSLSSIIGDKLGWAVHYSRIHFKFRWSREVVFLWISSSAGGLSGCQILYTNLGGDKIYVVFQLPASPSAFSATSSPRNSSFRLTCIPEELLSNFRPTSPAHPHSTAPKPCLFGSLPVFL